jgi:hypothetical protein
MYVYMYVFFIYTLFTLHAPLLCSNTTCIVVTYIYSSLPFLFIVRLLITLFYVWSGYLIPYSLFNTILSVNVCMDVCMYVGMDVFMCVCICVCVHVCMYVCMHICMYVRMFVCVCVYIYIYIYICMDVFMCVCICMCVFIISHFREKSDPVLS